MLKLKITLSFVLKQGRE